MLKNKPVVTRQFLLDLAKQIYNPTTKKFLHLCDGKLQNGPDPTDEDRPMHCGLGELYFAMTGLQPNKVEVDEDDVVSLAVESSSLFAKVESEKNNAFEMLEALHVPFNLKDDLLAAAEDFYLDAPEDYSTEVSNFKAALDRIPRENDDKCGNACDTKTFRERSKRVALVLREAAKLLPA